MARLIEIQDVDALPPQLLVSVGDMLWFSGTGGRVHAQAEQQFQVVELTGAFVQSVVGSNGQVLSPAGPPNVVVFIARHSGQASIDVMIGDPWRGARTTTLQIAVGP